VLYTREQFGAITKLAGWSVAAYDGRIRVPLDGTPVSTADLDRLLSHEFVHAVVAMLSGRTVPAWLNEGLATALEPQQPEAETATRPSAPALPALTTLHRSFVELPTRDAEVAYSFAAQAVRRLIDRRGVSAVVALLEDLGRGTPFDRAFHERIAIPYEDFAAQLARSQ
jgi:hypothetical protein